MMEISALSRNASACPTNAGEGGAPSGGSWKRRSLHAQKPVKFFKQKHMANSMVEKHAGLQSAVDPSDDLERALQRSTVIILLPNKSHLHKLTMPNTYKAIKRAQEPQIDEDEKNVAYIRGFTASELVKKVMRDIYMMKKPIGVPLNKRNVIRPFEDATPIEFICQKNDCSMFLFTSHNKKRPNNLVMGRLFDHHILDMVEFGVESYKSIEDFPTRISLGVKPMLIFAGEAFETDFDMIRIKNLLNDFFQGPRPSKIRVKGIEHVIMFIAHSGKIYMRPYLVEQKKIGGAATATATCHDMGPQLDLVVRRTQLADHDHFTQACKQKPKAPKSTKNKNITKDELGVTHGKIHIGRQDFNKMYNVKY